MFRQFERLEGVHHHRQLERFLGADRFFDRARVRTMWNAHGVQGHHAFFHVLSAHEFTFYVVENLIGVDIAVVVGGRNGLRMVVKKTGAETADHKSTAGECLVNRWWLVNPTGDRLKVVDGKCIWEEEPVPTDKVEGVGLVDKIKEVVLLLDLHREGTLFINRFQVLGLAEITLTEGRVLGELAEFIPVAAGSDQRIGGFDKENAVVSGVEFHLVNGSPWDDEVIAGREGELAKAAVQGAGTFVDEQHLVGLGILVEVILHRLLWSCHSDRTIVVDEKDLAAVEEVCLRSNIETEVGPVFDIDIGDHLGAYIDAFTNRFYQGRRIEVIDVRVDIGKSLGTDQFFRIEGAIRLPELRMALMWDLAQLIIMRHRTKVVKMG